MGYWVQELGCLQEAEGRPWDLGLLGAGELLVDLSMRMPLK